MTYNIKIDYLKFKLDHPAFNVNAIEKGIGNFKMKFVTDYGVIHYGHNKSDKYSHVMSGKDCEKHRYDFCVDAELIRMLMDMDAQFTRIDIAITHEGSSLDQFKENHMDFGVGALIDQRHIKTIADGTTDALETIYIGDRKKRARKGVFRAYNYGLAHGLEDILTRYELEIGSDRAQSAAKKINEGTQLGATMRSYIDFPSWEDYQIWTSGDIHEPIRGKSIEDDDIQAQLSKWNWLHNQVAPSLGRAMARQVMDYGHSDGYKEFMKIAKKAYEAELIKSISNES